jgi:hypothetical protein
VSIAALNHLPIFATLFGAGLLIWGLFRKEGVKRKLGLVLFVIAAASIVPVYLTGEPAEEIIEHRPGVSEGIIHPHEEAAELAFVVVGVLGGMSALILLLLHKGKNVPKMAWAASVLGGLLTLGLLLRVAHLGGQIRHDELRPEGIPSQLEHDAHDEHD